MQKTHDAVNHPSHYTDGDIEVIDYIEDKKLPYHLGNAVKYISRAGKKNPDKTVEDLQKAVWYINRYIKKLSQERDPDYSHHPQDNIYAPKAFDRLPFFVEDKPKVCANCTHWSPEDEHADAGRCALDGDPRMACSVCNVTRG